MHGNKYIRIHTPIRMPIYAIVNTHPTMSASKPTRNIIQAIQTSPVTESIKYPSPTLFSISQLQTERKKQNRDVSQCEKSILNLEKKVRAAAFTSSINKRNKRQWLWTMRGDMKCPVKCIFMKERYVDTVLNRYWSSLRIVKNRVNIKNRRYDEIYW